MRPIVAQALLYLDNTFVGKINVHGWEGSWGIGEFDPGPAFARFAPVFATWSLLMHADGDEQLSPEASEELRQAEYAIDRFQARIHLPKTGQWRNVRQINIDGVLVEWKEV